MFYAISKRRRDINAAEDRGREEGRQVGIQEGIQEGMQQGRQEGMQQGRREGLADALDAISARLKDDPDANPISVIAELRDKSENGRH